MLKKIYKIIILIKYAPLKLSKSFHRIFNLFFIYLFIYKAWRAYQSRLKNLFTDLLSWSFFSLQMLII